MSLVIPWPSGASWQQEIALDRQVYIMRGYWNEIGQFWVFDLLARDQRPIVMGVKVVLGVALTGRYSEEGLPNGVFVAVSNDSSCPCTPQRSDMINRVSLIYVPLI